MKRQLMFALVSAALAVTAEAGPVDVPHSFQGGLPALASEVNDNFSALEAGIDDNAVGVEANAADIEALGARVDTAEADILANGEAIDANSQGVEQNASAVATLAAGIGGAGIQVSVDGVRVGRFLSHGAPRVEVDLTASAGGGTAQVGEAVVLATAENMFLLSPTGYLFGILTSTVSGPGEGTLGSLPRFFVTTDCTGQSYLAVEGEVGRFSTYQPATGDLLPTKRWYVRQGMAFGAIDPADPNAAYMVRRDQSVESIALHSLLVRFNGAPVCVLLSNLADHNGNEINSVVAVEPLDPAEAGVAGDMAGPIRFEF
jgi:hypothetical protein